MAEYKYVGKSIRKKDAMQLLLGKPVFVDDIAPRDALLVKVKRSPHANAMIRSMDITRALKVPGIEAIYTYEDVPQTRYTCAGQTFPEPSPRDRLLLDRHVRFVGDPVAIVAGETEQAVDKAMKLIKVEYEVLEPVLDYHTALDNPILVHPEDSWNAPCPVGADNRRNLCAHGDDQDGDVEAVLAACDHVIDHTYHVPAVNQAMMETFRTYTELDRYGRLHVIASTQVIYHCRRIIANALGIPKSQVRVEKPRIGGGFGAKQTIVTEVYAAFVTWHTGKPAKMIYSRKESQIAASPRHEMEVRVRLGATKDGIIKAIDLYTLSNTGAYGEHGPTTVGLSGHKSIPIYTANMEAFRFHYDVVYTNHQSSGAYRGYGATQGIFAVESAVNELADLLQVDPLELRYRNIVREGMKMPAYYGETTNACSLDKCIQRCSEIFDWEQKYPVRRMPDGKIRAAGVGLSMQGSGIPGLDVGSATIKLSDEGSYNLMIGAADMGTGCDTTLAQIAAETLDCSPDEIQVFGADTDASPYDSGSYASSTAYVTGKATEMACLQLMDNMRRIAAQKLNCDPEELEFMGDGVGTPDRSKFVSRMDIATKSMAGNSIPAEVTVSHCSPVSPPPFMAGMAEIELDPETGNIDLLNYASVVDPGTAINPNLVKVQAEGGVVQGIGMSLYESITYTEKGQLMENSLMQYKIPSRLDMGVLHTEIESSHEKTGPYGAKSVGEVVINTPAPAIAHAVFRATGVWHRDLPITPEKVLMAKGHA